VLVVFSPSLYRKQRAAMNREQARVEGKLGELSARIEAWRISKSRPGLWWPVYHWTEDKIRVHACMSFLRCCWQRLGAGAQEGWAGDERGPGPGVSGGNPGDGGWPGCWRSWMGSRSGWPRR